MKLDVLVNGENQVLSRVGLALRAVQNMAAGIDRVSIRPGTPWSSWVVFALHGLRGHCHRCPRIPELRGKLAVGIEAFEFPFGNTRL